jgi:glucan phosphoethanolaminetransferase (alkaline phosphatase superfamily)
MDYLFHPTISITQHWWFYLTLCLGATIAAIWIYYKTDIIRHYKTIYVLILGFVTIIFFITTLFQFISNQNLKDLRIRKNEITFGNESFPLSEIISININNTSNTSPILPAKDTTRCIFIEPKEKPLILLSSNNYPVDSIYSIFKKMIE